MRAMDSDRKIYSCCCSFGVDSVVVVDFRCVSGFFYFPFVCDGLYIERPIRSEPSIVNRNEKKSVRRTIFSLFTAHTASACKYDVSILTIVSVRDALQSPANKTIVSCSGETNCTGPKSQIFQLMEAKSSTTQLN